MSYSLDTNILLYASDTSSPHHAAAGAFLQDCASRAEPLCLCWVTLMSYLRIATHPSIFAVPLAPQDAMRNIDDLLTLPQVRLLSERDRYWACYGRAVEGMATRGNAVPDAHVAALLLEHDVKTLYTADSDFRRFSFLRVRNPLVVPPSP